MSINQIGGKYFSATAASSNSLPQAGERDANSLCETHLNHAWIARHIPHQGSMCLLDRVEAWDQQSIQCLASSHRAADNPLRADGRLGAACGIEYAAQAMAVHGALLAPADSTRPRVGYLVSVRGTQLHVPRLDDITADLRVEATCITRSENKALFANRVGV